MQSSARQSRKGNASYLKRALESIIERTIAAFEHYPKSPTSARQDMLPRALDADCQALESNNVRSLLVRSLFHYCCLKPVERTMKASSARKQRRAPDAISSLFHYCCSKPVERTIGLSCAGKQQRALVASELTFPLLLLEACRAHDGTIVR